MRFRVLQRGPTHFPYPAYWAYRSSSYSPPLPAARLPAIAGSQAACVPALLLLPGPDPPAQGDPSGPADTAGRQTVPAASAFPDPAPVPVRARRQAAGCLLLPARRAPVAVLRQFPGAG